MALIRRTAQTGGPAIINKEIKQWVNNWEYVSKRLTRTDIRKDENNKADLYVTDHQKIDKREQQNILWNKLQKAIDRIHNILGIIEDLNGRVGRSN